MLANFLHVVTVICHSIKEFIPERSQIETVVDDSSSFLMRNLSGQRHGVEMVQEFYVESSKLVVRLHTAVPARCLLTKEFLKDFSSFRLSMILYKVVIDTFVVLVDFDHALHE